MKFLAAIGFFCLLGYVSSHANPCPQYWHYVDNDGQLEGRITFANPPNPTVEYHVVGYFTVSGPLKSSYTGKIELGNKDLRSDLRNKNPLWYKVTFPQQKPVPLLIGLKLNDKTLCEGEVSHGAIVTRFKLEREFEWIAD